MTFDRSHDLSSRMNVCDFYSVCVCVGVRGGGGLRGVEWRRVSLAMCLGRCEINESSSERVYTATATAAIPCHHTYYMHTVHISKPSVHSCCSQQLK